MELNFCDLFEVWLLCVYKWVHYLVQKLELHWYILFISLTPSIFIRINPFLPLPVLSVISTFFNTYYNTHFTHPSITPVAIASPITQPTSFITFHYPLYHSFITHLFSIFSCTWSFILMVISTFPSLTYFMPIHHIPF